ncbi:MAG: hypothetical protein NVS2B4_07150 [Ramlibacter sp.]
MQAPFPHSRATKAQTLGQLLCGLSAEVELLCVAIGCGSRRVQLSDQLHLIFREYLSLVSGSGQQLLELTRAYRKLIEVACAVREGGLADDGARARLAEARTAFRDGIDMLLQRLPVPGKATR